MKIKIKNLIPFLKDQMPLKRFVRNFIVTRNAWGAFHINSHISQRSGKPKVKYNRKTTALKAAKKMSEKHGKHFSAYKCLFCDGYHLGKNKDNK